MEALKIDLDVTVDELSSLLEDLATASEDYITREREISLSEIDTIFKAFKAKMKESRKKGDIYRESLVNTGEEHEG